MDERIIAAAKTLEQHNRHGTRLESELIAALNSTDVSAKQIAHEIGISQQYLSDIKKGSRSVSRDLAQRLAGCR